MNICVRIFQEQMDLINQLPEQERAIVLYRVVNDTFNQIDNQIDFQDLSILSKSVYNLLRKNVIRKEFSSNYGGVRKGAGRPVSVGNNQTDNQNDFQIDNQVRNQNESAYISVSDSVSSSDVLCKKKDSNLSTTSEKKLYGEMQKVKLTDEEYEKLKAIYNDKLDFAIDKLDSYLAQKRKDPYYSHYAVMKRNGWVYNEAFPDDDIPSGPKILDPKNFVRAKPFGEEFNA